MVQVLHLQKLWWENDVQKRIAILMALPLLAACDAQTGATDGSGTGVGIANPASTYCAERGGRTEIRAEADGEVGYCHLPDGSVVEEWALFRQNHPQK